MSLEGANGLPGGDVPQADGVVLAAGGQGFAVLAEGDAGDGLAMTLEDVERGATVRGPIGTDPRRRDNPGQAVGAARSQALLSELKAIW